MNLKATTLIVEKYGVEIPEADKELCNLLGVGSNMSYSAMKCAWGVNVGIGVNTLDYR